MYMYTSTYTLYSNMQNLLTCTVYMYIFTVTDRDFSGFSLSGFFYKFPFFLNIFLKEEKYPPRKERNLHVHVHVACIVSMFSCLWGCEESVNPPKLNIQEVQGVQGLNCPRDEARYPFVRTFYFCQITPLEKAHAIKVQCFHGAFTVLSRCFHGAFTVLSRCFHGAFTVLSRCFHGAFTVLSLCFHCAFTVLSRCFHGAFTVLSRCFHGAFTVLSRCFHGAFTVLSRCFHGAFTVLSHR